MKIWCRCQCFVLQKFPEFRSHLRTLILILFFFLYFSLARLVQIIHTGHCDAVEDEANTEYSVIAQTSSISSVSGSGSTSATGASNSLGSTASGAVTNVPIQSTRQYITVTQSPLIQKRTSNAKQEASDVKVNHRNNRLYTILSNRKSHRQHGLINHRWCCLMSAQKMRMPYACVSLTSTGIVDFFQMYFDT